MSNVSIVEAVWGTLTGSSNVTAVVQALVDGGATSFTASNATLGKDPSPGLPKHFAMSYRVGVGKYTAAATEGQTVKVVTTPPRFVVDAVYGALGGSTDVTSIVQMLLNTGATQFTVGNALLGDPAFGNPKHFGMTYVDATGTLQTIACGEGDVVTVK